MTGLDAVREKLERVADPKMWREEMGELIWRGQSPDGNLIETQDPRTLISEALALLEAEPSEQMRRDHDAMEKLREAGGSLHHWGESDGRWVWTVYSTIRTKQIVSDPADAILGAPTDGEGT